MLKFTFNRETSRNASNDLDVNRMFICHTERYLNDILKVRSYVYLNQIYEAFGVTWDPNWENRIVRPDVLWLSFAFFERSDGGFDVEIVI